MRDLNLVLPDRPRAAYLRLAAAVRECLRQGQIRPGELLPSTRRLADQVGIHRHTVLAALDELVAEGWLTSEPGRGYRVHPDSAPPEAGVSPRQFAFRTVREVRLRPPEPDLPLRFPSGQPDLRLFPSQEYFTLVREVLRRPGPERLLAYSDPGGQGELLEELAVYLRRIRSLRLEGQSLIATHGSQEAIYLLGQLLVAPGQVVLVEELGYPPAWQALQATGARLVGLRVDGEGVVPDSLAAGLAHNPALIYLTPHHQYPTTVTLSRARRQAIYELAARQRVPILEDDYDHEFHYRSQPVPPMKSEDPEGLILYCSTFSKVLYPAARLGFAVVPEQLAGPLRSLKQVVSRQNDNLTQLAVALWMRSGGLERHLRRMRRTYEGRLETMWRALHRGAQEHGLKLQVTRPDGGMCLWASLGCAAAPLAGRCAELGVGVTPGERFRLQAGTGPDYLRLGFAGATGEEIEAGMAILCRSAGALRGS